MHFVYIHCRPQRCVQEQIFAYAKKLGTGKPVLICKHAMFYGKITSMVCILSFLRRFSLYM